MKTIRLITTLTAGIGLLSLSGCSRGASTTTAQTDSVETRLVQVTPVVLDTVELSEEFTATILPEAKNNISAQSGGRLSMLSVKVGDRVHQGQIIARLDAAQLNQSKIQLDNAKLNFARTTELYEIGGISKAQWEQAESSMNIAQQVYNNLLANTHLSSPISGVVSVKNYDVGDMTSPTLPIVVIEQIQPVKVTLNVSEKLYTSIRKGMPASVFVEALGSEAIEAYVSIVHPTIDSRTHTVAIEVEMPNRDEALRPGMYSRVRLGLGKGEVLLVPDKAVQRMAGSGERYVFVLENGKAVYRPITLGKLHGDRYEILSGVQAGDPVISSSVSGLVNGSPVAVESK